MIESVIRTGRAVSIEIRPQLFKLISYVLENLSKIPRIAARCQPAFSRSFHLRSPCDTSREHLGAPLASLRHTKTRHLQFAAFYGNTMPQTNIELVKDHLEVKAIYANPSRIVVREC